jgi:hypothetical protein
VTSSKDETLFDIEKAQAALRESIEKSKALAEKTARLVEQNRGETPKAEPPNPAQ